MMKMIITLQRYYCLLLFCCLTVGYGFGNDETSLSSRENADNLVFVLKHYRPDVAFQKTAKAIEFLEDQGITLTIKGDFTLGKDEQTKECTLIPVDIHLSAECNNILSISELKNLVILQPDELILYNIRAECLSKLGMLKTCKSLTLCSETVVEDDNGKTRALTAHDLRFLLNMPQLEKLTFGPSHKGRILTIFPTPGDFPPIHLTEEKISCFKRLSNLWSLEVYSIDCTAISQLCAMCPQLERLSIERLTYSTTWQEYFLQFDMGENVFFQLQKLRNLKNLSIGDVAQLDWKVLSFITKSSLNSLTLVAGRLPISKENEKKLRQSMPNLKLTIIDLSDIFGAGNPDTWEAELSEQFIGDIDDIEI